MFFVHFEFVRAHWTEKLISGRTSLFTSNPNDKWVLLPIVSRFKELIIHILFFNNLAISLFLKHYIFYWEISRKHGVIFKLHALGSGVNIKALSNVILTRIFSYNSFVFALAKTPKELHDVAEVKVVEFGSLYYVNLCGS